MGWVFGFLYGKSHPLNLRIELVLLYIEIHHLDILPSANPLPSIRPSPIENHINIIDSAVINLETATLQKRSPALRNCISYNVPELVVLSILDELEQHLFCETSTAKIRVYGDAKEVEDLSL